MVERQVVSKTFGRYIILHTIGKGEFGKVKLAYDPQEDIEVAIKFIKRSNITSAQKQAKLEREINILQNLDHPNIVRLYDVIETEKYIGIVMAYANGGELFEYISENQYLTEEESAKFFIQLLDGVQYLHSRHIVHRDLKLENLLLDQKGDIIITDFGFANNSRKNPSGLLSTSCGSPCYAAPELVINDNYIGEAADIWSCGIILYAMLCGYLPFDDDPNNPDGENLDLLYKYILESQLTFPDYVSEDAQELVCGMLIPDPEKRWPMEKVINHRWLRNSLYNKERMNESMNLDYMYDSSYYKYINESSNSEIENMQESKVPDYPSLAPESNRSRQIGLDDETENTEVYENRNASSSENVDSSMDKTECIQNQDTNKDTNKDAIVPNESNVNIKSDVIVPEIEKQQSIGQSSSEQEFLDAMDEMPIENTKVQDDPMEIEGDEMEVEEFSESNENQFNIEEERVNTEKQIDKLINEIQEEEFTQLENMKDQLQEVIAGASDESKKVVSNEVQSEILSFSENEHKIIEDAKEEGPIPEETTDKVQENKEDNTIPETTLEKVEEFLTEKVKEVKEEVKEVIATKEDNEKEKVEEVKEEVKKVTITEVDNEKEKIEEVKEEDKKVTVPEVDNDKEKVEEVKEEVDEVTVQEVVAEKVEGFKEIVNPEIATEKVKNKNEAEVKEEENVESPSTLKLEKEDLIEVDDESKNKSLSSTFEIEKESVEEKKENIKEIVETEKVIEDVEMKYQDTKESEITTIEDDEIGMLRKRNVKKSKKDKQKIKKRGKEIKKNEKVKNKKNIKVKIRENKMFRVFFGCVLKDSAI
ncbi:Pkinase-domain-containing protein [Neocallimastix lanati (nom. inval.)]|jgi:serine/threonine protein kinase|uniref:Pkinase-domain-containing protein n=1 Tax=Neocallimastix californiae TaxID=1754190 RepID=A0A1Y2ACG1_9FUNG|nr:Pkinase-domain-containing protein [Neocallimastix sp. JGI-2020a]ORY20196.1 Pkinase-domain-containing protein [Neocallimastix californiae]|eukprot:ORY20196.1 Pkinase-domain-containing protein [Neocallimastix californiae]